MASERFVSRGGEKLQAAITNFRLSIDNKVCLDVGSSTGGFVDCLLQNGAVRVYALDTAYGELSWKLRQDKRVVVMERTNILHLNHLPEKVDLITIDAGWTKLELVLPVIKKFLKDNGLVIALLKPHYQSDQKKLIKGVLPKGLLDDTKNQVIENIEGLGFEVKGQMESPILGGGGNTEFLLLIH